MSRMSYKQILRAKHIRPIPVATKLRSSLLVKGEHLL